MFSFHCVKLISHFFLLLVWKEIILLIIKSLPKSLKSYKLDNSCIYISRNYKYYREIINSQSHLSNIVWNECYTYSRSSNILWNTCVNTLLVGPLASTTPSFSFSLISILNVYYQVIDDHISFFFFMDKRNALKVFTSSPTLTWQKLNQSHGF
jgi:hypothetical protein